MKTVSFAPSAVTCKSSFAQRAVSARGRQAALSFQYFDKSSCISTCFVKSGMSLSKDGEHLIECMKVQCRHLLIELFRQKVQAVVSFQYLKKSGCATTRFVKERDNKNE